MEFGFIATKCKRSGGHLSTDAQEAGGTMGTVGESGYRWNYMRKPWRVRRKEGQG